MCVGCYRQYSLPPPRHEYLLHSAVLGCPSEGLLEPQQKLQVSWDHQPLKSQITPFQNTKPSKHLQTAAFGENIRLSSHWGPLAAASLRKRAKTRSPADDTGLVFTV